MRIASTFITLLSIFAFPQLRASLVISEFLAANDTISAPNAVAGRFDDWIEIHNPTGTSQDLGGWRLTDDAGDLNAWIFPAAASIPPNSFLVVFASGDDHLDANGNLHTSFRLSKGGEYLALVRPDGTIASEFDPGGSSYPSQSDDISYGHHPDTDEIVFFDTPTPGSENDQNGIARVSPLEVSPTRGLYQSAQQITLSTSTPDATIYYTVDGTPPLTTAGAPSANASIYNGPISLNQTTVVRSAATAAGLSASDSEAHTYLLLDIDNATPSGTDANGLNTPFLQQTQPSGYGNLSSGDYNMDPDITRSTAPSAGHGGLTVAQAMLQGIREAPTISISLPASDFTALYANSQTQGLERVCSAEFLPGENDTRSAFQEHCGLRVQGGASRIPSRSPKHSLSFRFRSEYGEGRLRQALFPEVDIENFNSIALRAGYNNSWIHSTPAQRQAGSMIRDQWMRESLRDMGNEDAGAGFLAHLFVNGLYWGLHNVAERQDNAHYANYDGGDSDLIDARNGASFVEGDVTAWNSMRTVVSSRNWEDIQEVLDVDNYIDFQIIQRFGGNQDLKTDGNWRAAGGGPFTTPTDMRPWKLYSWDGERVLESVTESAVPLDPMGIRGTLEAIPEYRQRFADRAHMHLTGDGALTPAKTQARWEKFAAAIDKAIIAESARWGDHRAATPYDRDDWLTEQNRLYNSYFPDRTNNVIARLNTANLFPSVEAPVFAINGQPSSEGFVGGNNQLTLNGGSGTIYYTVDGSDPLLPDGSINPSALTIFSGIATETIFPFESSGWRYLASTTALSASNIVSGNASYGSGDWKHPDFDDTGWVNGQGLIAGRSATAISGRTTNTPLDIGPSGGAYPTVYFRREFEVINAAEVLSVTLSLVQDDGVIAYLNGKEIFRENMPNGVVTYSDFALGNNPDETEIFEATQMLAPGDLIEGINVLTIEVHNASANSSDLGLDATLSLSRPAGEPIINLAESSQLVARLKVGDDLSAPVNGTFLIEEAATSSNLLITEINYHPREASLLAKIDAAPLDVEDRDQFEFIELFNSGTTPINLSGVHFIEGIDLMFGLNAVAPGERALVVRDEDAFLSRYGIALAPAIVGTYSGSLDNDGETLTLVASDGSIISSLTYNDAGSWPARPDGDGSSLERIDLEENANDPDNWAPSVSFHGSPGVNGLLQDRRIVINEVRTADSGLDFIELHNATTSTIEIGGWLLTDSKNTYPSYEIPPTSFVGMDYLTISSDDFNAPAANAISNYSGNPGTAPTTVTTPSHGLTTGDLITIENYGGFSQFNDSFEVTVVDTNSFSIDATFLDNATPKGSWQRGRSFGLNSGSDGDRLWLVETDNNGRPLNFVDQVDFAAAAPGTTLGRWPDGLGLDTLVTMTARTPGEANSGPVLGPLFISEVHYAPQNSDSHEFVEIANQGEATVSLEFWKLRGGLDFDFSSTHSIPSGQSVVIVTFDPVSQTGLAADFRSHFGITASVSLIGPATDGPLNDDGGTVRLQQGVGTGGSNQVTIDEVRYLSSGPWPLANNGPSLTRNGTLDFGNFPSSWNATAPSPGQVATTEDYQTWASANGVGAGDLDQDGDSLSNLLEFALGTNPNLPDELPVLQIDGSQGAITFTRHTGRSGVTLEFQTSTNLENWTTRSTTVTGLANQIQTNSFTTSLPANTKLFWRLRALAF